METLRPNKLAALHVLTLSGLACARVLKAIAGPFLAFFATGFTSLVPSTGAGTDTAGEGVSITSSGSSLGTSFPIIEALLISECSLTVDSIGVDFLSLYASLCSMTNLFFFLVGVQPKEVSLSELADIVILFLIPLPRKAFIRASSEDLRPPPSSKSESEYDESESRILCLFEGTKTGELGGEEYDVWEVSSSLRCRFWARSDRELRG